MAARTFMVWAAKNWRRGQFFGSGSSERKCSHSACFLPSPVSPVQAPGPWGGGVHIQAKSIAHQLILPATPSHPCPAAVLSS